MEITTERIAEAVNVFKKMDSGSRSFSEAYNKGEPYFFKRHRLLIVPSEIINTHFGCSRFRMDKSVVEALNKYGAKRAYRQIYENGKQSSAILVWIFEIEKV